jgi:hypothetical protein
VTIGAALMDGVHPDFHAAARERIRLLNKAVGLPWKSPLIPPVNGGRFGKALRTPSPLTAHYYPHMGQCHGPSLGLKAMGARS